MFCLEDVTSHVLAYYATNVSYKLSGVSQQKVIFLTAKVRSDSKLHAKTSKILVRHSLVVLVEFLTLHKIRESRAEELHAKTGIIVCISKCCWVCASAPSPYSLRGQHVLWTLDPLKNLLATYTWVGPVSYIWFYFILLGLFPDHPPKKNSTEWSPVSKSGIANESNRSMFCSQYCWISPGTPVKTGWKISGYS